MPLPEPQRQRQKVDAVSFHLYPLPAPESPRTIRDQEREARMKRQLPQSVAAQGLDRIAMGGNIVLARERE